MSLSKAMSSLFKNSVRSIQNWKKENRPIIKLIENYFSKEELEEFLQKQKIRKFELVKNYTYNELEELLISNDKNDDFYYNNALFKLKNLGIREKAILYHSIKKFNPTNKDELLNSIKSLKLTKVLVDQFISVFKLQNKEQDLDMKIDYSFDQDNLYKFINDYISEEEVKAFLKKPKFD